MTVTNTKVLLELFQFPSPSGQEQMVVAWITQQLNILQIAHSVDEIGNIWSCAHGGRPLLCAHLDSVSATEQRPFAREIKLEDGMLWGNGMIGADDKAGVYIILHLLALGRRDFNFLLTVQEECGRIGVQHFLKHQSLSTIPFALVLDRRGRNDLICTKNHYGSQQFEKWLLETMSAFGYVSAQGWCSDADVLCHTLESANLSVGYYDPHTAYDYLNLAQMENAISAIIKVLDNADLWCP